MFISCLLYERSITTAADVKLVNGGFNSGSFGMATPSNLDKVGNHYAFLVWFGLGLVWLTLFWFVLYLDCFEVVLRTCTLVYDCCGNELV